MLLVIFDATTGDISNVVRGGIAIGNFCHDGNVLRPIASGLSCAYVPDQNIDHIINDECDPISYDGKYPDSFAYLPTQDEISIYVDANTGNAVSARVHDFCGTDEQLGILRDLLVQWGNALGLQFTDDFTRWNEIAITEIEKAKAVKDAQDN